MDKHFLLLICFLCSEFHLLQVLADDCRPISQCYFACGKEILDLTKLGRKNGKPRFPNVIDNSGRYKYSYSPCSSFSEGSGCINTSVCQVMDTWSLSPSETLSIGKANTMTLNRNGEKLGLTYTDYQKDHFKTTKVSLVCQRDQDTFITASGEDSTNANTYLFTLNSPYACLINSTVTSPSTDSTTSRVQSSSTHHLTIHVSVETTKIHRITTAGLTTESTRHDATTHRTTEKPTTTSTVESTTASSVKTTGETSSKSSLTTENSHQTTEPSTVTPASNVTIVPSTSSQSSTVSKPHTKTTLMPSTTHSSGSMSLFRPVWWWFTILLGVTMLVGNQ